MTILNTVIYQEIHINISYNQLWVWSHSISSHKVTFSEHLSECIYQYCMRSNQTIFSSRVKMITVDLRLFIVIDFFVSVGAQGSW